MTPLDKMRAVLDVTSPEWGAILAAQVLAEALRRAHGASVLTDVLQTRALEKALAEVEKILDAATGDPDLCDDEGCPHHGTPHACRSATDRGLRIGDRVFFRADSSPLYLYTGKVLSILVAEPPHEIIGDKVCIVDIYGMYFEVSPANVVRNLTAEWELAK